jgi:benzoate-CoA ligase family protein
VVPEEFNLAVFLLDRHVDEGRGKKVAAYYKSETYTFTDLAEAANRVGNAFLNLGVERENRVMICLPDSPQFLASYLGAMKIGAVPVPVSTMAMPQDYLYYLNDSRAKVLIVHQNNAPSMRPLRSGLPHLKYLVVAGKNDSGELNYDSLLADASTALSAAPTSRDDMAFWMYSSGTTGKPKGVVHLHHDMMYFMPPHCEVVSMNEKDIVFSTSKLYFSYGRNNSLEAPFMCGAGVVLYPGGPDPEKILDVIERYHPTLFYSVPSSYSAILTYLDKAGRTFDLSSVRHCISAGEPLPKLLMERWREKLGQDILDTVGSTDVGAEYLSNKPGLIKPGSSGVLLPGFEGRLIDEEGHEVPQGEMGTLWIKGEGTAAFYWNNHQKTKESFHGEWFDTGDKFYKDSDDYYWYSGRADDMFKAGGIWVSPLEVEGVLLEHPAVNQCSVIAAPDAAGLEKPVAFVVLNKVPNPSKELERELQDFLRNRIAHYKCPRWIRFLDDLPRTASGKVQRYKLRAQLRR